MCAHHKKAHNASFFSTYFSAIFKDPYTPPVRFSHLTY
jgi:hypothetical protein